MRDTTKRRNIRLRVLHGGVDIEPENMDAAKAEYLDRQESKQAAQDVRDALKRMHQELGVDKTP
jgi:F420-dependent methylenetetrahydromethanopterin dehydrogenase